MRSILLILFILIRIISPAHELFRNLTLTDSKINIMYLGVENIFEIDSTIFKSTIRVISKYGEFTRAHYNDHYFSFFPAKEGIDTVYIFDNNRCLLKLEYRVLKLDRPICQLGSINKPYAKISEVISNTQLTAFIPNSYLNTKLRIVSFQVFKVCKGDTVLLYEPLRKGIIDTFYVEDPTTGNIEKRYQERKERDVNNSNDELLPFQISEIRKMISGDKILIQKIYINDWGCGRKIPINDILITIE